MVSNVWRVTSISLELKRNGLKLLMTLVVEVTILQLKNNGENVTNLTKYHYIKS